MLTPFDARSIEAAARRALGLELCLVVAARPLHRAALSAGESAVFRSLATAARRREWLTGRLALKRLLERLGAEADTSAIAFPHARYSLSHSAGVAVAAGSGAPLRGLGVDVELRGGVDPRVARWFLTADEQSWVPSAGKDAPHTLLRLWTVKEALYKADAGNAGRVLTDYCLAELGRASGCAARAPDLWPRFRYASFRVRGGYLSIAAALGS